MSKSKAVKDKVLEQVEEQMNYDPCTPAGFFRERADWLRVRVMETPSGSYDVVLVIDGQYTIKSEADELARFWAEQLRSTFHIAINSLKEK